MKLTRYGRDVMIGVAAIVVGLVVGAYFVAIPWLQILLAFLALSLTLFTLYFFRDPERTVPREEDVVISPADGKVVVVADITDNEYHNGPAQQISIFLSPLDVHVNRNPISGTVDYYKYHKGKYLVAWHDKASTENERTHIGIANSRMRVLFKQIAGAVARRIVCDIKVGDDVLVGERFGMIKFGSRTDIILTPDLEILVKLGDVVVGGETVIARMREAGR